MLKARSLSTNSAILIIGSGGSTLLAFFLSVLVGRVTGEAGLGVYVAVLAWVFPLLMLAEFGTNTLLTRDVAVDTTRASSLLGSTGRIRLGFGAMLTVTLLILAPILSDSPQVILGTRIAAPLLLIEPTYGAYTALFRAHRVVWPLPVLNVGMLLLQLGVTATAFAMGYGVLSAVTINTITSAVRMLAAVMIYRRYFDTDHRDTESIALRPLMIRAWPFALAGFLAASQLRVGFILLEQWAGPVSVGLFAAASRFTDAVNTLARGFFDALLPSLGAVATHPAQLAQLFRRAVLALALAGLGAATALSLLAAPLISVTYGLGFSMTVPVLTLLAWSLVPGLLRGGLTLYHYAQGNEGYVNWVLAGMLALWLILGALLIPRFGAIGAAATTVLVEGCAVGMLWGGPKTSPEVA